MSKNVNNDVSKDSPIYSFLNETQDIPCLPLEAIKILLVRSIALSIAVNQDGGRNIRHFIAKVSGNIIKRASSFGSELASLGIRHAFAETSHRFLSVCYVTVFWESRAGRIELLVQIAPVGALTRQLLLGMNREREEAWAKY